MYHSLHGYSVSVPVHHTMVSYAIPLVKDALEHIAVHENDKIPFHLVEYGAADGGTTKKLINEAIVIIKKKWGSDKNILISYEDQPTNDYNALVNKIYDSTVTCFSRFTPETFVEHASIFVSMCATSFYTQCFPKSSVDLGISFSAMHWLERSPSTLKSCLFHESSCNERERQLFADEARKNWETILLQRARELRPGGRLVFSISGVGEEPIKDNPCYKFALQKIEQLWVELFKSGTIKEDEYTRAAFRFYFRTVKELRAPLEDTASDVYKSGLRIVSTNAKTESFPFREKLDDPDSVVASAKQMVASIRAWSNSTFYDALSDSRSHSEKMAIVDAFYDRYENNVIKYPAEHDTPFCCVYVYIRKIE